MGSKFLLMSISHLNHSEEEEVEGTTRWEEAQVLETPERQQEEEEEERSFVLIALSRMPWEEDRIVRFVDYRLLDKMKNEHVVGG